MEEVLRTHFASEGVKFSKMEEVLRAHFANEGVKFSEEVEAKRRKLDTDNEGIISAVKKFVDARVEEKRKAYEAERGKYEEILKNAFECVKEGKKYHYHAYDKNVEKFLELLGFSVRTGGLLENPRTAKYVGSRRIFK